MTEKGKEKDKRLWEGNREQTGWEGEYSEESKENVSEKIEKEKKTEERNR